VCARSYHVCALIHLCIAFSPLPLQCHSKGHGPIEGYHKDQSSWQWFHKYYPIVAAKPLECTIGPGEVLYFPDRWWHATINWNPYTAFVSTFASEHEYVAAGMMWSPGPSYRHDQKEEL
jgi:hypothetical protein